jgi:DNA polymerase
MTNNYQDILKQIGYPTDILCLDFETYFDTEYSLKKMSTIEYIMDERFELTGLGMSCEEQAFKLAWGHYERPDFIEPCDIDWSLRLVDWDKVTVLVQQARFDITILQEKFGIVPKYIIDLKDLASHYDARMSHRLADMAKMFDLKHKGDTMQFKGLHWSTMTEEQRKNLAEYTIGDVEIETDLFKILLPKLTNPIVESQLMRHTLDLWLHKRFRVDTDMATKLKVKMRTQMAKTIKDSGHTPKELRSKKFVGYLKDALPDNEQVPMKQGKRGNIPALAKDDEACQQLVVHPKKEVRDLVLARLACRSWPTHIKRVQSLISQTMANGGLLRVPLTYYPAHTGRWGGSEKINLQNMGGAGRRGTGHDPLIGQVKEVLMALPGCVLGIADSSQIEARLLAWLAGQMDLLNGFARGEDVYSEFATTLFRTPIRKPKKTDLPQLARYLEIKRGFGKDSILGCGYGMGAIRFHGDCLKNPSLRPLFDSGQYDFKFIEKLVKTYRTKYSKIPEYWGKVERAFKQCIRFPHLEPTVGPVTFRCRDAEVQVELPSSRVLYYRHCRIDKKKSIKYHGGALWGGSITENIIQSVARDLLGFWILECERIGLSVVLHIHDSIITLMPEDKVEEQSKLLDTVMCSLPDWAEGFPAAIDPVVLNRRLVK